MFSHAKPIHKQDIILLLKKFGEVVAITGDGVKDASALKLALWNSLECGHACKGQRMDVVITKKGLLESNVIVGIVLLNMYMKMWFSCGDTQG